MGWKNNINVIIFLYGVGWIRDKILRGGLILRKWLYNIGKEVECVNSSYYLIILLYF